MVVNGLACKQQRQHRKRRPLADLLGAKSSRDTAHKIRTWMLCVNHPHRADKPVAFAHYGFKKARLGGIIAQRRADFADDVVEVPFGIDKKIRAPELFYNLLARNHLLAPAN